MRPRRLQFFGTPQYNRPVKTFRPRIAVLVLTLSAIMTSCGKGKDTPKDSAAEISPECENPLSIDRQDISPMNPFKPFADGENGHYRLSEVKLFARSLDHGRSFYSTHGISEGVPSVDTLKCSSTSGGTLSLELTRPEKIKRKDGSYQKVRKVGYSVLSDGTSRALSKAVNQGGKFDPLDEARDFGGSVIQFPGGETMQYKKYQVDSETIELRGVHRDTEMEAYVHMIFRAE